jgi:hypothetical protein
MRHRREHRNVIFDVVDGALVRTITFPDGDDRQGYTHRCTREVYERVAHAVEESGDQGVTLESIAKAEDAPFSQVNVALEFMKERGCVVTRHRRTYPASKATFEDAMCEFMFLAELPY